MYSKDFESVRADAIRVIESSIKEHKNIATVNDDDKETYNYWWATAQIYLALKSEIISYKEYRDYNDQLDKAHDDLKNRINGDIK